jgi:GntR family transcriptional regulator, transcriptional repressor for pyruvate dehydrogenase complex
LNLRRLILYDLSDDLTTVFFVVGQSRTGACNMMPTSRLKRPDRLADAIISDVASAIGEGRLAPGGKLETETAMAGRYGVSRAVVREALAQLKADGLVMVRQGAGAYVSNAPGAASFKIVAGSGAAKLRHLFELRLIVEGAAAGLAATRAQPQDLRAIEDSLTQMRLALAAGHDGSRHDGLFHEAIANASHNPELARFVTFLGHAFDETRAPSWTAEGRALRHAEKAVAEHQAILDAIAAGHGAQAQHAAEAHIRHSGMRTLGETQ